MATKKASSVHTATLTVLVQIDTSRVDTWKGKEFINNEVIDVELHGAIPGYELALNKTAGLMLKEGGHILRVTEKAKPAAKRARKAPAKAQVTVDQGTSASAKNLPAELLAILPTLDKDAQIAMIKAFGSN